MRHETTVRGRIPSGIRALTVANEVLKGSIAVGVDVPDAHDLFMGRGNVMKSDDVVWFEEGRSLNWLGLTIGFSGALALLMAMRVCLKPVAMVEIAGGGVDELCKMTDELRRFRVDDIAKVLETRYGAENGSISTWSLKSDK